MFVANRAHQIQESTGVDQRHHVSSKENSDDDASRGLDARKETSDSRWFNGPSVLWQAEALWLDEDYSLDTIDNDVEVKREGEQMFSKSAMMCLTVLK